MSTVVRATGLIGRPVVTLDAATAIAEVKDVVFDPSQAHVVGFTLRARGVLGQPKAGVLSISRVASIGRDAVTIEGADVVDQGAPDVEAARSDSRNVLGNEVLTEAGIRIGTVVDLVLRIDGASAEVAGYEVAATDGTHALIPIPSTLSVSGKTLMVPSDIRRFVADDLTGFGAAVEAFAHEGAPDAAVS